MDTFFGACHLLRRTIPPYPLQKNTSPPPCGSSSAACPVHSQQHCEVTSRRRVMDDDADCLWDWHRDLGTACLTSYQRCFTLSRLLNAPGPHSRYGNKSGTFAPGGAFPFRLPHWVSSILGRQSAIPNCPQPQILELPQI